MVKIDPPDNIDELKKRGGSNRHIVKRVIDSTTREELDSADENNILEKWLKQTKPDDTDIFYSGEGYPAISRLDEYVVVAKEVDLKGHRIDSVIRWPEGQPDGHWKLVEVKKESGLGPGVVGHLMTKKEKFKSIFNVRPNQVEIVLLADSIPIEWKKLIKQIESGSGVKITVEEIKEE